MQRFHYLLLQFSVLILSCFYSLHAMAVESVGDIANTALEPTGFVSSVLRASSFTIGGALFLAALIQYKEHRDNPVKVNLSKAIAFFLLSFLLIALPFLGKLSPGFTVLDQ